MELYQKLSNPLLPQGPRAGRMASEHWDGEHPSEPPALEFAAKCPMCYLEGSAL